MTTAQIQKTVHAWQWNGEESGLPDGFFLCRPEVHYSADRTLVYFTYADFPSKHWISAKWLTEAPPGTPMLEGYTKSVRDGVDMFRKTLPFAFWKVKSEASVTGDHKAKYLNRTDSEEVDAFLDYAHLGEWGKTKDGQFFLPPRLEYRETDGKYERGYRPYYLKPGDWLIQDGENLSVMSDEAFMAANPNREHMANSAST